MDSKIKQLKEEMKVADLTETNDDNLSLEEIISNIAKEEGMTYDETLKLFKKGLRIATGAPTLSPKAKAKVKAKRKATKKARKKNRK